jgi:hypothetical protein
MRVDKPRTDRSKAVRRQGNVGPQNQFRTVTCWLQQTHHRAWNEQHTPALNTGGHCRLASNVLMASGAGVQAATRTSTSGLTASAAPPPPPPPIPPTHPHKQKTPHNRALMTWQTAQEGGSNPAIRAWNATAQGR